ncbi:Gfo/Idh/MocA family protein [Saccharospirillum mangrovi]|uniref:Gfo/Idh/MocA family protein n=1 Tax=Saccharospirillum mangrovi TaxID=2161747 RepID=UPI0013006F5E|nr:Gfo/Idh/MocA family oxidoreductase [Saccharospirillum mangrovi]
MASTSIRWGIIGAGIIAHKLAQAVQEDTDSELVAVASRTPEKAAAFAAEFNIDACDYETLVSRADIDVVYIATTHNFHHDNARLALEHNKSVLVEKPFTVNADQASALIELARARGVFLMEAIWTRFLPAQVNLKTQLDNGLIGDVRHLTFSFGAFVPPHYEKRLKDPNLAGGVTLDMGIYPLTFANFLLGERPETVKSMAEFGATGVDELAMYLLRYPSGATASISTSCSLKMKPEATIYGTQGYVEYPGFQQGNRFVHHRHDGSNEVLSSQPFEYSHHANGFVYQVAEVVGCLRAGQLESAVIPLEETRSMMQLMDGMRAEWDFRYPFE